MRAGRQSSSDISFREFQAFTFGSVAELTAVFGSIDTARSRWQQVRSDFMEHWDLWGRPEAWWLFEPGIPDELRSGPPAVITYADAERWNRLDEARRRYLRSMGIDPQPTRRYTAFGED